ncbi:MAG TPA: hypothetical protein VGQ16_08505 [Vicinamibacterales bacterium]|nr:hypothetical protein [Vicinamibacterales bacterium]
MCRTSKCSTSAELAVVLAALLAIAVAATYPLIGHLRTHLPNDLGDPVLATWILAWGARALASPALHVWDAPSFFPYGHTLAYAEHLLGFAPFTAPLEWLTGNPVLVYNIAFLGSFVNAGAGMYLLARTLTGRRDAAFLAALMYAFTPFRIAHIAHLQWLMTGWLPLSLWALHRYFSTGALRFLVITAIGYVLQSLSTTYCTYFALLPLGVIAVAETWRVRPSLTRTAAHAVLAAALVVVALGPVVRAYSLVREDREFKRAPYEIEMYSADVGDYVRAHDHVRLWRYAGSSTGEHELFPGAVVIALAALAAFTVRDRHVRLYAGIAATAFVLSLGPSPAAWGHKAPFPGPYQLLLAVVPGLDGLRAVSRLGLIVLLSLSVLAAFGAARLLGGLSPRRRTIAFAVLGVAIVAEGWSAPISVARFDPLADTADRQAYDFLRQSEPGALVELPLSIDRQEREIRYQYLTLVHGHRTVNGSSGYDPPIHRFVGVGELSALTDGNRMHDAIGFFRGLGVRYLVVHLREFENPAIATALLTELRTNRHDVAARHEFGSTAVFTLAPADPAPPAGAFRAVPAAAIHARTSHQPARLPLLFDRDRDTRWLTGERQAGGEWIELTLDRPRAIALVRMQTAERSFDDYPRELAIDAVEGDRTQTLFRGSIIPAFGRGLAVNRSYPNIDIVLPDNHARMIRLRQLGATDLLFWSIHEIELWER